MKPITFKQCFTGAWRDGWSALRSRPLLSLTVAVIGLVSNAVSVSIKQLALTMAQNGDAPSSRMGLVGMALVVGIVNVLAYTVLALHVYRQTVLGVDAARQARWYRDLGRYIWTTIQFGVGVGVVWAVVLVVAALAMRGVAQGASYAVISTVLTLLLCAMLFVFVRVSLIFPQIAVGRSKRWRAAWDDSRGHFWVMFGTAFVTMLPLLVAGVILTIVFGAIMQLMPSATTLVLGTLIIQTVLAVVWISVGAGVHGWIYLRYADKLLTLDDAPDDL